MERLIEYLIVVGSTNPHLDVTVPPELLRKFPKEDHDDFPLPIDVVFFCQPEGCPTASKRLSLRETNSFVFTLTEKDSGIVRYGVCCNFFRPSYGQKDPSNQEGSNFGDSSVEESPGSSSFVSSDDSRNERRHARVASCRTLTSICIISRYPFISTFRECLFVLRRLIESRSQAYSLSNLAQDWNVVTDKERHRMKYVPNPVTRNWAMFLNPECYDDIKHPLTKEINEIELWIEKLLNIPLPMAGCHRIEVELLPRHVQPPLTFALPEKSRFSLLDFPLHLPLELLGVETCLKVLTCILLEYKVSHFLLDIRNCNIEVHKKLQVHRQFITCNCNTVSEIIALPLDGKIANWLLCVPTKFADTSIVRIFRVFNFSVSFQYLLHCCATHATNRICMCNSNTVIS